MESILTSIKKMLGITEEYEHFDQDIIMHINTVFMILNQLGVGPSEGFSIQDSSAIWSDFVKSATNIEAVKSYMYLKVRLLFDPPLSSAVIESIKNQINELEWRLNVSVDTYAQSNSSAGSNNSTIDISNLATKDDINNVITKIDESFTKIDNEIDTIDKLVGD